MAIDANIFQMVGRGVKSVADYDNEASQSRQNKLAEMMGGMKLEEHQRGIADQNALRGVYSQFGADSATNTNSLYKAGLGKEAGVYAKSVADLAKDKAATEKDTLANTMQKLSLGSQLLGSVTDQATYDQARVTAQAQGLDVSRMPPAFDPAFVAQKLKEGQTVKEQLDQHWKQKGYDTPDANAVLQATNSAANNAATIVNSASNAKLADVRARDLNTIKQEEVKIKREAKDETTNLTKSSQLASFDTMLGTLDRLAAHPGLSRSVGVPGAFPTMPGSNSANFQAELNSFQSQAFIPMVAQLKGMGALSDAEGKKLTAAVGALDPKMGEVAFRESVARITTDMQAARARMAAGGKSAGSSSGASGSWADEKSPSAPVKIKSAADYDKIPSGATYMDPNGQMRTKK